MKVRQVTLEHNNQVLEIDLLVPLTLEAVEAVVKRTQLEIQANRERLAQYESQLRKEYGL